MYHAAWVSFNDFFIKLDRKPESWEDRIALFVAYLIDRKQPEGTIRSYISGIKSVLKDEGIVIDNNSYMLASLLKACKCIERDTVHITLLIKRGMLRVMIDKLRDYYLNKNQPVLVKLYVAMMMTAYYGLFRIGELTQSKHAILFDDIHMGHNKGKIMLVLRSSKTHKKSQPPQCMKINAIEEKEIKWATDINHYYPHKILTDYRHLREESVHDNEQFFVEENDSESWTGPSELQYA